MANRVKIEIVSQPMDWQKLAFSVTASGFSVWYDKTFLPSGYFNSNPLIYVKKEATATLTFDNLFDNLVEQNASSNVSFELDFPYIYMNFTTPGFYTLSVTSDALDAFVVTTEDIADVEPDTIAPLDLKDVSIEVIDTYTNDRVLIEETAQANACVLRYDGGDDIAKSLVNSTLSFNMLVENGEDAHFFHLLTGDEQRYLVKVNAINEDEEVQLIWQGFILPDEYKEPYQKGNLFVSFTATDMIGTLKGKFFEPWYYQNTFPIAQLLAYCLAATGLEQNIIVKPSIVPTEVGYNFSTLTIPLKSFLDNDKPKDLYEILKSVIESNGLTLTSIRGYWMLEGFSRKRETSAVAFQFDAEGVRMNDIQVDKIQKFTMLEATPTVAAVTPWKKVNIEYKANGTKNLFSDTVVAIPASELFYSYYKASGYNLPVPAVFEIYAVKKLKKWIENISSQFRVFDSFSTLQSNFVLNTYSIFSWDYIGNPGPGYDYLHTEQSAMNNYFQCKETPYVKPGNVYEFEIEFSIYVAINFSEETFTDNLANGVYDRLAPFQIFINGVEKFSNRPSFSNTVNLRYEASLAKYGSSNNEVKFKLKFTFSTDVEGYLTFRYLVPIHDLGSGINNFFIVRGVFQALKLTLIEDYEENSTISAVRNINYTQVNDYKIELSSTVDSSVLNSIGLNTPSNQNYFKTISRTNNNAEFIAKHFFVPNTDLDLVFETFVVPYYILEYLFENQNLRSVFLTKNATGKNISFTDLWFTYKNSEAKLAFLKSYEGFPVIPKKYNAYPGIVTADVLKYMQVEYPAENYSARLKFKIFNDTEVQSFAKCLGKMLHGLQPEPLFTVEGTVFDIVFPNDIMQFYFKDENRNFIPTKTTIDLFAGKSSVFLYEDKFQLLTDIDYE